MTVAGSQIDRPPDRATAPPDKLMLTDLFADRCVSYLPHLRRYAWHLARDRSLAEDLIQDTLLRALANEHRFSPGSDLRAWLFTIMRNNRINGVRSTARWGEFVNLAEVEYTVQGDQEVNQQLRELSQAMEQLPAQQHRVLLLAHAYGFTYMEIAQMLSLPGGTVRSRLARGRALLRSVVEDAPADPTTKPAVSLSAAAAYPPSAPGREVRKRASFA